MIFTDKDNYDRGDSTNVFGCLASVATTKGININVYDMDGNEIDGKTFVPNHSTFSADFEIDDKFSINGTYTVTVDAAGMYATSKTIIVPEFGSIVTVVLVVGLSSIVVLGVCSKKILKI